MATEYEQAKEWRRGMRLTMDELADLTGYSREAIFRFETGTTSQRRPHAPHAWRRYKLACLAVMFMLHFKIDNPDAWEWRRA